MHAHLLVRPTALPGVAKGSGSQPGGRDSLAVDEDVAMELAAGLVAERELVAVLGPFLSPYLPRLLCTLLHPAALWRGGERCAAEAAAARAALPAHVPARLLLQPLFSCLPAALEGGLRPAAALMQLVALAAGGLPAQVAAAHHEPIFGFLLRALDVRHAAPPALRGGWHPLHQLSLFPQASGSQIA